MIFNMLILESQTPEKSSRLQEISLGTQIFHWDENPPIIFRIFSMVEELSLVLTGSLKITSVWDLSFQ